MRRGAGRLRPLRARDRRGRHRQDAARRARARAGGAHRPTPAPRAPPWPSRTRRSRRSCANACADRLDLLEACGPFAPYLAPLLPELGIAGSGRGRGGARRGAPPRVRRSRSRGPAAIVLDDLHWADEATLALLPRARSRAGATCRSCWSRSRATRCRPTPTGCAACARSCAGSATCSSFRCGRSTAEDTARLAAAVAGEELDDDVIAALHERSHGIPFYVEELAAALALRRPARTPEGSHCPRRCSTRSCCAPRRSRCRAQRARAGGRGRAALRDRACRRRAAPMRSPRRWPRGSSSRPGPDTSSSATRSCATRSTRRSVDAPPLAARVGSRGALDEAGGIGVRARDALARRGRGRACPRGADGGGRGFGERLRVSRRGKALRARARLGGGTEPVRFELLERLATCAELAGDLAGSARAWREAIDGRAGRGEVENVAEAQHAMGRVLALRGSPERALAAWMTAADAFAACGRPKTRLAPGSRPLRSCTSAAISAQRWPRSRRPWTSCRRSAPPDLRSRARSLEGVVLGKLGETPSKRSKA